MLVNTCCTWDQYLRIYALRLLSVLLGIVAYLLIGYCHCSGISRRTALLAVKIPHIEARLPVRGAHSPLVCSTPALSVPIDLIVVYFSSWR